MTVADLANPPLNQNDMNTWTFAHSDLCLRTIDYLNDHGADIEMQSLDPVALFDVQNFLLRLQTVHDGVNANLGIAGFNLLGLNINDPSSIQEWAFNVFSECQQWTAKTGVA